MYNVYNRPTGENSPNLVTLLVSTTFCEILRNIKLSSVVNIKARFFWRFIQPISEIWIKFIISAPLKIRNLFLPARTEEEKNKRISKQKNKKKFWRRKVDFGMSFQAIKSSSPSKSHATATNRVTRWVCENIAKHVCSPTHCWVKIYA
jgi:hypothetical protein